MTTIRIINKTEQYATIWDGRDGTTFDMFSVYPQGSDQSTYQQVTHTFEKDSIDKIYVYFSDGSGMETVHPSNWIATVVPNLFINVKTGDTNSANNFNTCQYTLNMENDGTDPRPLITFNANYTANQCPGFYTPTDGCCNRVFSGYGLWNVANNSNTGIANMFWCTDQSNPNNTTSISILPNSTASITLPAPLAPIALPGRAEIGFVVQYTSNYTCTTKILPIDTCDTIIIERISNARYTSTNAQCPAANMYALVPKTGAITLEYLDVPSACKISKASTYYNIPTSNSKILLGFAIVFFLGAVSCIILLAIKTSRRHF